MAKRCNTSNPFRKFGEFVFIDEDVIEVGVVPARKCALFDIKNSAPNSNSDSDCDCSLELGERPEELGFYPADYVSDIDEDINFEPLKAKQFRRLPIDEQEREIITEMFRLTDKLRHYNNITQRRYAKIFAGLYGLMVPSVREIRSLAESRNMWEINGGPHTNIGGMLIPIVLNKDNEPMVILNESLLKIHGANSPDMHFWSPPKGELQVEAVMLLLVNIKIVFVLF